MKWIVYPLCAACGAVLTLGALMLTRSETVSSHPSPQAMHSPLSVLISGVQGAPGDGNIALENSVRALLGAANVPLVDGPTDCTVMVSAEVSVQNVSETDRIRIVWQVHDREGLSLGEVAQVNDVPTGALTGTWGQDAQFAARGARDGIVEILRRKPAGCG